MKTVIILSGGMDSAVLLAQLVAEGHEVACISFDYGQRHSIELVHARRLTQHFHITDHEIADVSTLKRFIGGNSQTDPKVPVPQGHYAEASMKATVVPNRNMIMLAIAGGWAISKKFDAVAYAAHGGDHAIYPDCRETFARPLGDALLNADWHPVKLVAPYLHATKAELVTIGAKHRTPFVHTWSCYDPKPDPEIDSFVHCGKCGTCTERIEAFKLAGVEDPTRYKK